MHVANHPSEAAGWLKASLGDARYDEVDEIRQNWRGVAISCVGQEYLIVWDCWRFGMLVEFIGSY